MKAIAAMDQNRVIGLKGKIPWKSKEDFQWFKEFTMDKTIVVGKNTFDGLPKLPGRKVLVPVRDKEEPWHRISNKNGLEAVTIGRKDHLTISNLTGSLPNNWVIAGGAKTYLHYLPFITEFYITLIEGGHEGDTYMPEFEGHFLIKEPFREIKGGVIYRFSK